MLYSAFDKCYSEQYLFNVFEVIVSTLESKLQRIENLDKAVEHLMRRVEALDSRVNDNIDKTDAVITKLRTLDLKLFHAQPTLPPEIMRQSEGMSERADGHQEESGMLSLSLYLLIKTLHLRFFFYS